MTLERVLDLGDWRDEVYSSEETRIVSRDSGEPVAWFPITLWAASGDSSGQIRAGAVYGGETLFILKTEGMLGRR